MTPAYAIIMVVDVVEMPVAEFADKFDCEGQADASRILSDVRVDAVLVCTNSMAHADVVRAAVLAGILRETSCIVLSSH